MGIVVSIVFAGLIVFVPNDLLHPSWTTAFLIDDYPRHVRSIVLYGRVKLDHEVYSEAFKCNQAKISDRKRIERNEIHCELPKGTEISLDGVGVSARPFLPAATHEEGPISDDERKDKEWLLHISNIDPRIRGISSKADTMTGAKISFPWEDAESCELDGEEEGANKYEVIGFQKNGSYSTLKQAVAESLLFKLRVQPGRLKVVLSNNGNVQVINVDCFGPDCFAMAIDNSLARCVESEDPGMHFQKYYNVVSHDLGAEMLPFRKNNGHCPPQDIEEQLFSKSLLGCDLKLLAPVSPKLARHLDRYLRNGDILTIKKLTKFLGGRLKTKEISAFKDRLDVDARQVMNRVICPPVVASP